MGSERGSSHWRRTACVAVLPNLTGTMFTYTSSSVNQIDLYVFSGYLWFLCMGPSMFTSYLFIFLNGFISNIGFVIYGGDTATNSTL